MTEKCMLEKMNDLLADLEDDEKRQAFLNDFDEFLTTYHQPTFEVGEYYARGEYIYRVEETDNVDVYVSAFNTFASIYVKASWSLDDITNDKPATAEQIAEFERAEHFASKGREWSEFKKGDIVQNTETMQLGLVESVDEDGDALVNYNIDKPLIYPSCCKCTGALFLNLVQTAEELREVRE